MANPPTVHPDRPRRISWRTSVTFRLSLMYLVKSILVLGILSAISYGALSKLNRDSGDVRLEPALSRDAGQLAQVYRSALQNRRLPAKQKPALSPGEIVLLLNPEGGLLDRRGPLSDKMVRMLAAAGSDAGSDAAPYLNLAGYRILKCSILDRNQRLAILMVGLPRTGAIPPLHWVARLLFVLLLAALGGSLMAYNEMNPARLIVRTARAIHATDLRQRLHWNRKDEFGELASTFDDMLARLEAAFQRQTRFTADASHELRTPLTVIGLEINRALTQARTTDEYRQVLELIQAENDHMTTIVNGLLLLARADKGTLQRQQVDLSDVALACTERLLSYAQEKQIRLSTGELPELPVSGDPQQLSSMVMNILDNAIKYTSGIGRQVHVDLASEEQTWAVLRVNDDGPGIPEEHLPYLFDRFYRVDKARTQHVQQDEGRASPGGSGLGLAIVQWIAQSHGGQVHVISKVGRGSCFVVKLPLSPAS